MRYLPSSLVGRASVYSLADQGLHSETISTHSKGEIVNFHYEGDLAFAQVLFGTGKPDLKLLCNPLCFQDTLDHKTILKADVKSRR